MGDPFSARCGAVGGADVVGSVRYLQYVWYFAAVDHFVVDKET